ncbi:aqualysin-1-like [Diadema antillarum]|uniref:aqualysin-1-like n=1 Tax=Diadema antillarum TaxID=105358 RepID=UPI003A8B88A7
MNTKFILALFALIGAASAGGRPLAPLVRNPDKFSDRHIVVLENEVDVDAFSSRFSTDSALIGKTKLVRNLKTALRAVIVDLDPETVDVNSDCNGHGTHCAGTAAGTEYGVAKEANVYAVKVCNCYGSCSTSAVVSGVNYVAEQKRGGVDNVVASMSLSLNSWSLTTAVENAIDDGVVVVTSSGNNGYDACNLVPGNIDAVITVGNTQEDDTMRSSSNYGTCVDILAPGTYITSASHQSDYGSAVKTGTSMACPHVAGAAAILMANRKIQPSSVSDKLVSEASSNKISGDLKNSPNKLLYVP